MSGTILWPSRLCRVLLILPLPVAVMVACCDKSFVASFNHKKNNQKNRYHQHNNSANANRNNIDNDG